MQNSTVWPDGIYAKEYSMTIHRCWGVHIIFYQHIINQGGLANTLASIVITKKEKKMQTSVVLHMCHGHTSRESAVECKSNALLYSWASLRWAQPWSGKLRGLLLSTYFQRRKSFFHTNIVQDVAIATFSKHFWALNFSLKRTRQLIFWSILLLSINFCPFHTSPNSLIWSESIFRRVWALWKKCPFGASFRDDLTSCSSDFGCQLWRTG